jgi:replication factor A1
MAAEQMFLPIVELSAYQRGWSIKARVTNKSQLRTFSNRSGGQGKVFSVDLLDAMGGEIRASFFNEAVDKFGNVLEKGKCVTLSKGTVKIANRQYNNCNHRYELTFDKDAIVEIVKDDASIETVRYNFVTLRAVAARSLPTTVDLCGIISSFKPTASVTSKEGVELVKREIMITDDTATSMSVTLWGDRAKQADSIFDGQPTVVLKSVAVKEFRESRSGSLSSSGELVLKPNMPEAQRVQQWWSQGGASQSLTSLSEWASTGVARNATPTSLAGLRLASEKLGAQPELFTVVARVAAVQLSKQGEVQPLYYMACQEAKEGSSLKCNRRVDTQGFCATCNRAGKVEPRFNIRCRFVDFEDAAWLTGFHEAAEKILDMSADTVRKDEADREALETVIRSRYFEKPLSLTIRAKLSSYNGEPRTDMGVIDARPVSHAEHGRSLLKEVNEMLSQGALAGA